MYNFLYEAVGGLGSRIRRKDCDSSGEGEKAAAEILGMRYEAAWRLARWTSLDDDDGGRVDDEAGTTPPPPALFHKFVFDGFKCFQDGDEDGFKRSAERAVRCAAGDAALKAAEACSTVYPAIARLETAVVLGDVWSLGAATTCQESNAEDVVRRWKEMVSILSK